MKISLKKNILILLFCFCIGFVHYLLIITIHQFYIPIEFMLKINIFVLLLTLVTVNTVHIIQQKFYDKVGFSFLAFVIFKMLLSVVFLYPFIQEKPEGLVTLVLSFFVIFFLYLIFEILLIINNLKNDKNH